MVNEKFDKYPEITVDIGPVSMWVGQGGGVGWGAGSMKIHEFSI